MCELDTLIDFTQYLDYREKAIRSGRLMPVGSGATFSVTMFWRIS